MFGTATVIVVPTKTRSCILPDVIPTDTTKIQNIAISTSK